MFEVSAPSQTQRTRPHGRVVRVWAVGRVVGRVQGHPRQENVTLELRFLVWGVGNVPDTKNATLWSRPSCQSDRE